MVRSSCIYLEGNTTQTHSVENILAEKNVEYSHDTINSFFLKPIIYISIQVIKQVPPLDYNNTERVMSNQLELL